MLKQETRDVSSSAGSTVPLASHLSLADVEARIDAISEGGFEAKAAAAELLALGEQAVERWIEARGEIATNEKKEGFRILALHRQGAKGEPSFNACRETCRELVYHYNLVMVDGSKSDTDRHVRFAAMVAKHLCLFISGKLQVAGLGEFCCAAKPLRAGGTDM